MLTPSSPETPAPADKAPAASDKLPQAVLKHNAPLSLWLVWLVPLTAVLIGLWLGAKSVLDKGPVITLVFRNAEGLEAGKTKIKYKDVDIGLVKGIRLTVDHKAVEVTAELKKTEGVDGLLVQDTRFWVVRPQVNAGGVSGLGTLLSGAYIGLDIGHASEPRRHFEGLEVPPIVTADLPGRKFLLKAQNLGSLGIGSPVYFRRVQVGQVVAVDLDADGRQVSFTVFVHAPYDRFVTARSRFWQSSGIDVTLGADGVRLNTESLASVLSGGGIAFQDLAHAKHEVLPPASENALFTLHEDRTKALKEPDLSGFDYLLLFQSSVRGLTVGAPVDFRGMTIGEVTAIGLENLPGAHNPSPKIAVSIKVYLGQLPSLGNQPPAQGKAMPERAILDPMIAKGFRAQLRNGNLLTGQLYVALDFFERTTAATIDWRRQPAVLPTVPGSLDGLQDTLLNLAEKLDKLPLDALVKDLRDTLNSVNQTVQHVDTVVQQVGTDLTPETRKMVEDARGTLQSIGRTLDAVEQGLGPAAPLPTQAHRALAELTQAARSLRALADTLERHPESLLRGKPADAP